MRQLSKAFIAIVLPVAVVLLAMVVVGWLFSSRATAFMDDALRTYLRTSAALAAREIRPADVVAIQYAVDVDRPEYRRLVGQLHEIRSTVASARFAYIFRRTDQPLQVAFVADADGLSSDAELDVNGNGVVDADEEAGLPGELYDVTQEPMLQGPAFMEPSVGDFYVDQWGELISGYAPIRADDGTVVAVLGIDMQADEFRRIVRGIISPLAMIGGLLTAIVLAGYVGVALWRRRVQALTMLAAERSALIDLAMHQIGAPLAAFRWWTDILQEGETRTDQERAEAYDHLHASIGRMQTVIKAMQSASAIENGGMAYESHMADLNDVITAVADDMRASVTANRHTLTVIAEPQLRCRFDPRLISGVIEELVRNAVSYSPAETTITIRARRVRDRIEVLVHDDGRQIPPADLHKLFQPFTRGADAYRQQPVGNGMGLYVAKHIIEVGGGTLTLESAPEKGTTVTFTLPMA